MNAYINWLRKFNLNTKMKLENLWLFNNTLEKTLLVQILFQMPI